jgi:hypothetical protein
MNNNNSIVIDCRNCTNQTTSWLVHSLNTFGAWMNHRQTRTHKTHHLPHYNIICAWPRGCIQMSFCLGIRKLEVPEFSIVTLLWESVKMKLTLPKWELVIPIGGVSKELWPCKVPGIQTRIVSGLLLGSHGTKNHSDVGAVERHIKYYMEEGGGFPRVQTVVSLVSPELPAACPSTNGVPKNELTNLLVGLM